MPPPNDKHDAGAPPGLASELPPLDESLSDSFEMDQQIKNLLQTEETSSLSLEIYRRDPVTKRYGYLKTVTTEEWLNTDAKRVIAEAYGGGEYRARIRKPNGVYGQSINFSIDALVRPMPPPSGNPEVDALKRELAELRQEKARAGVGERSVVEIMQAQTERLMLLQQKSTDNLMAVMTAVLSRPAAPPPPQPSDRLLELLIAKTAQPAPSFDLEKMVGAFGKIAEMLGQRGGRQRDDEEDGGSLGTILMKALPMVASLIASLQVQPGAAAPAAPGALPRPAPAGPMRTVSPAPETAPIPAAPAAPEPVHAAPTSDETEVENVKRALGGSLPQIAAAAATGQNAADVAGMIIEGLPPAELEGLRKFLERDDWLAVLIDVHEPVSRHVTWFNELRDELLADEDGDPAE